MTMQLTGMHVVLIGNPIDGLRIYGPFKTGNDAVQWASEQVDDTWWIAPISHPESFGESN